MDYEKLYKEAIERAKEKRDKYECLDGEKSLVPSDIEYIFPELKESEDEKNIKDLIDELKCSLRAANCQKACEWLKKNIGNYQNWEYNEFHQCVEYDGGYDIEKMIKDFRKAMEE